MWFTANASGANIDLANFDASEGFRIIGGRVRSVGHSVSAAGDVNGDGRMDLLIGVRYRRLRRAGSLARPTLCTEAIPEPTSISPI